MSEPGLTARTSTRERLVPMQVGGATVYVAQIGDPQVEGTDEVRAVSLSPEDAFGKASDALRECVRVIGERVEGMGARRPNEVSVEFTLSFQVKGRAFIPVLFTGETGMETGIKVNATWQRG
jgi:hypothetical protein